MVSGSGDRARAIVSFCRIALFLTILSPTAAVSQEVRVRAHVDSADVLIGDWIRFTLAVEHPENVEVVWPAVTDSLGSFEIVRKDSPSIQTSDAKVLEHSVWIIAAFDSGLHTIPPLEFRYTSPSDNEARVAETSPISVNVRSIPVDPKQDIRDIKPPLSVPMSFEEILPYLAAGVMLAGLAWLAYVVLKKRKLREILLPPAPSRPAHEAALEALRRLEAERLWQRGKVKEYHTELTDILRTYIDQRFAVTAMERTTEEILSTRAVLALDAGAQDNLREILIRADLVKFARFSPLPQENEESLPLAVSFVELTFPLAETPNPVSEVPA